MSNWQDNIPRDPPVQTEDQQGSSGYGGTTMLPQQGYGNVIPWNKEMMQLLTDVPIPEHIIKDPKYAKLWLWANQIITHMSLTSLTVADKNRLRLDLEYILILGHQDGSEMLCAERQLMFIAELELSKSIPDSVHGIRERLTWISTLTKNIFGEDHGVRPGEQKSGLNIPFLGGKY